MTNTADFLFEILTEELPPKALKKLEKAFADSVISQLQEAKLSFSDYHSYATPRRLAIVINELQDKQANSKVERKGPAIQAAYDADGNPTKAALGFAKSCGIELSQATTIKSEKGEWLYVEITQEGKTAEELLPAIIQQALSKLPIPKLMRWGEGQFNFIRPVHNLVMLLGEQVIPTEMYGKKTGEQTSGHRFHHPDFFKVTPSNYVEKLQQAKVIAGFSERRSLIKQQTQQLANEKGLQAAMPEELLDEVAALVEWPVALLGSFDKKFLQVPKEALMLSLQSHQKYFPLMTEQGDSASYFVVISNIESKDPSQVVAGNEKVSCARLSDAEFFFETDKKIKLEDRIPALANIIFQKQLGSLADKVKRVTALTEIIAPLVQADPAQCKRAAQLCKTDLLTEMVMEFPELQGIMGRYYATHDGETTDVAIALDEQYMPRFSGDELPRSKVGQVLAIAERLDTLVGIFGIGKIPTGMKDPFALRRACLGILRIITEKNLDLDLRSLISLSASLYADKLSNDKVSEQIFDFCIERLKNWMKQEGIRPDVFDAVAARNIAKPLDFKQRLDAVNAFLQLPEAANLASANKRVSNILTKQLQDKSAGKIDPTLLEDAAEIALAEKIKEKVQNLSQLNYQDSLTALADLNGPIDNFFTDVMVMAENEKVRANRLALLSELRELFLQVADISLLQN
jgi:glycyl-tRNA synthetase beta chain